MTTLVVLGDSAARGVGDQVDKDTYRGFGYYLSKAFAGHVEYRNVSRPGARTAEVLSVQVPAALDLKADFAILIVGGNDVLRNDFNPNQMYRDLREVVVKLRDSGCTVISMNLHNPLRIIRLPRSVGKIMLRRIQAVNRVYEALASELGLQVLDVHNRDEVYSKDFWHVDRLHPSRRGHQFLAGVFADILRAHRAQIHHVTVDDHRPSRRIDDVRWMLVKGTPWFIKRSFDLLPAMVLLTLIDKVGLGNRLTPQFTLEAEPVHMQMAA